MRLNGLVDPEKAFRMPSFVRSSSDDSMINAVEPCYSRDPSATRSALKNGWAFEVIDFGDWVVTHICISS